jgi:hypothetical protein
MVCTRNLTRVQHMQAILAVCRAEPVQFKVPHTTAAVSSNLWTSGMGPGRWKGQWWSSTRGRPSNAASSSQQGTWYVQRLIGPAAAQKRRRLEQ